MNFLQRNNSNKKVVSFIIFCVQENGVENCTLPGLHSPLRPQTNRRTRQQMPFPKFLRRRTISTASETKKRTSPIRHLKKPSNKREKISPNQLKPHRQIRGHQPKAVGLHQTSSHASAADQPLGFLRAEPHSRRKHSPENVPGERRDPQHNPVGPARMRKDVSVGGHQGNMRRPLGQVQVRVAVRGQLWRQGRAGLGERRAAAEAVRPENCAVHGRDTSVQQEAAGHIFVVRRTRGPYFGRGDHGESVVHRQFGAGEPVSGLGLQQVDVEGSGRDSEAGLGAAGRQYK